MSFFQKVREAFGLGTGAENPIDSLDGVLLEETIAIYELNKAQIEFDEISEDLELKKSACNTLIEKGNENGQYNKNAIEKKIEKLTTIFLNERQIIFDRLNEIREIKASLENKVLAKAVEFTALLDDSKQAHLYDLMNEWGETGIIAGEEIDSHPLAIVKAIDEVSDGFFQKAKAAQVGDIHTWGSGKFQKTSNGWIPVKSGKPEKKHSTQEIVAHAENTSSAQLKKVASDESKDVHIRDAAKREIERRNADKDTEKRQWAREDKVRAEDKDDEAMAKKAEAKVKAKERADAAVAELAQQKPKKKKKKKDLLVKYTPSEDLHPDHSKIEKDFGKYLNNKFKEAKIRYEAKFGNVLNVDNARELSDDYEGNRSELSSAVHEPASAFIKKLYADKLAEETPEGKRNMVLFTAGGTGAGKTTGIQQSGLKKDLDRAHVIFDTNMNGYDSSVKKVDQALAAGKNVKIAYTFRDPVDAFQNGAVPRSLRIGRTVPIADHVNTHLGSMDTMIRMAEKYKDNPKVKISVIDNSRGAGNAVLSGMEFVRKKNKLYNATELREQLHKINQGLYEQGKITDSHFRGFKGNG